MLIREMCRLKLTQSRRLDYFVNSEQFEVLFAQCKIEEQEHIGLIVESHPHRVEEYMQRVLHRDDIESFTVKDLRKRCASLGMTGYWSLTKADLLMRILDAGTITRNVGPDEVNGTDHPKTPNQTDDGGKR